jgi:hypothetical protein
MSDYIEREPLLKLAKELQGNLFGAPLIVAAIENAPAVAVWTGGRTQSDRLDTSTDAPKRP